MKHSGEERNLIRFERKEDFPQVDDGVQTSGLPLSNLAGCRVNQPGTPCQAEFSLQGTN